MKYFLLILSSFYSHAIDVDRIVLNQTINDHAQLFSQNEIMQLDQKVRLLKKQSHTQVGVVTIDTISPLTIDEVGIKIAEKWQLGDDQFDNGLIIIIAKSEKKIRIEVAYGLEGLVTDYHSHKIIQEIMIPQFKQNNPYKAVYNALNTIDLILKKSPEVQEFIKPKKDPSTYLPLIFIVLMILLPLLSKLFKFNISSFIFGSFVGYGLTKSLILALIIGIALAIIGFAGGGPRNGGFRSGGRRGDWYSGGSWPSGGGGWSGGGGDFGGGGASGGW